MAQITATRLKSAHTDGWMDGWTNKSPPVFYRASSPSGPLPKKKLDFITLTFTIKFEVFHTLMKNNNTFTSIDKSDVMKSTHEKFENLLSENFLTVLCCLFFVFLGKQK